MGTVHMSSGCVCNAGKPWAAWACCAALSRQQIAPPSIDTVMEQRASDLCRAAQKGLQSVQGMIECIAGASKHPGQRKRTGIINMPSGNAGQAGQVMGNMATLRCAQPAAKIVNLLYEDIIERLELGAAGVLRRQSF